MEYRRHPSWGFLLKDTHELLITALISGIVPIIALGLGSFLFFLVRAPAVLAQRERDAFDRLEHSKTALVQQHAQLETEFTSQIEELQNRLAARDPALHFKIEWLGQLMMFLGPQEGYGSNILVEVSIRNSGERTALSDWTLEIPSVTSEAIPSRMDPWVERVFDNLRNEKTGGRETSDVMTRAARGLSKGDIARGALMFLIPDISARDLSADNTLRACLRCVDARGLPHVVQSDEPPISIGKNQGYQDQEISQLFHA